jgi:D-alanine-D-alanine ligase
MRIKVGVIFGGESVEHEVSIISAIQAINSMDTEKYDIVPIYIDKNRTWYTGKMLTDIELYKDMDLLRRYAKKVTLCKKDGSYFLVNTSGLFRRDIAEIDIAFPIVHGINVEDGTLQGYLDTIGIPYVGSRVIGAALGQDKVIMKQVFESAGIPIVPYTWFFDSDYYSNKDEIFSNIKKIGFPVIVKPANLGSSVGISVAKNNDELVNAIEDAIKYDTKIVVEKVIENMTEVNCSVLGNYENQQVGVLEEVMGSDEILSYQDKYLGGGKTKGSGSKGMASTSRIIPARISDKMTEDIKETSKKVFRVLNLGGVCRIDYLIDKKNKKFYVNEPNTIPGSLSFYLWEPVGKPYSELLDDMINIAIKDFKNRSSKTYSFDTNILNNCNGLKGSKGKLKG